MDPKERSALVSDIQEDLAGVVGASGKPEELVKLTTRVVKGVKRLLQDVPDPISSLTTTSLASFIKSAQVIAKNPRGVDSRAISELSTSRKDVEKRLDVLEKWHLARDISVLRKSSPEGELEEVVDAIVKPVSEQKRASPEEPAVNDHEQKLTWQLQGKRDTLLLKMEPQRNPPPVPNVGETLTIAVKGLMRGAEDLTSHTDKKLPTKEQLLEPMIVITDMVCKLLDVVDNLFVSKYPMRSQVYSFCSALLDNVFAYGCRSKSNDITSLRSIGTQTPALLNAAKVMVEQCERRSNSIEESREMSLRRGQEIDDLETDSKKSKKTTPPSSSSTSPLPSSSVPASNQSSASDISVSPIKQETKNEVEICCIVCTGVAVDQKTQQPISKGTELSLMVLSTTTVKDVKQDLSSRTGLPYDNIQFNQGQSELSDDTIINPKNPLPYFLFNRFEPSEEELRIQRKDERSKSRMKIYDLDWSQVTGPVAVALYEYDTLGDDNNLAFDEGDVIEIVQKGFDGWWDGRIADKTGSFPASFVEEIHSRDEGVRLLEMMKKKKGGGGGGDEELEEEISKPPTRQSSEGNVAHPSNLLAKLKKRGASTPDFSSALPQGDKARVSGLFKKKKARGGGYTNLAVFEEEGEGEKPPESPEPQHRVLDAKAKFEAKAKPDVKVKPKSSRGQSRSLRLPKVLGSESPASSPATPTPDSPEPSESQPSPQMNYKRTSGGKPEGGKRRPPPPRPPPFASTHPAQAAKLDKIIKSQQSEDADDEDPPTQTKDEKEIDEIISFAVDENINWEGPGKEAPPTEDAPIKTTNSMEDLLNNLKEFDECTATSTEPSYATLDETQGDVLYEVISPPAAPPTSTKDVVTIKISDYRPDTDDEIDAELDGLVEEEEEEKEEKKAIDGLLFTEDEQWNPREWAPSPEPEARRPSRSKKPPSWSFNVTNSPTLQAKTNGAASQAPPTADKPHPPPVRNTQSPISGLAPGDSTPRSLQGSPVPPPTIITRPRKSPHASPQLAAKQPGNVPADKAPPPVPPPRQKRAKPGPPGRAAPPPPPKPFGFSSSRSDMDLRGRPHPSAAGSSNSGERRWTVSQQREQLRIRLPSRSRSPVVQRKTKAIVGEETHLTMNIPPDEAAETVSYTGIGKQGVLMKESSTSSITDWKSRYFHLVEDGLIYYESTHNVSQATRPLGELPLNKMVKVIPVGEKNQLKCFAILMKYETSIILGCHSILELEDWMWSINQLIETTRLKDMSLSYLPSVKAAEDCLEYLLNTPATLDKTVFKLSGDFSLIKSWLQDIEAGQEVDLSYLGNPGTALSLLKSIVADNRLGYIVPPDISKEISQLVKRSSSVRDIQSKLHHLHDELLRVLQMFLKLFSKILGQVEVSKKHKLEVSDLNRMFGSALFGGLKSNSSLTLLSYLISTHELMF